MRTRHYLDCCPLIVRLFLLEEPMRTILQDPDSYACGVACTAMLAGVSYLDASYQLFGDKKPRSTTTAQIRTALNEFGVATPPRLQKLRPSSTKFQKMEDAIRFVEHLERDALLKMIRNDHPKGSWHWVVWDAKYRRIRNPLGDDRRKFRITSYLEVLSRK